jgi:hypothetical protein
LHLPLPPQSILISVGRVIVDLQCLSTISFWVIRFHPFAHDPPTLVYWILLYWLYLVHCKALLILCCISYTRALSHTWMFYNNTKNVLGFIIA